MPDQLLHDAAQAARQQDWPAVIQLCQRILKQQPDHWQARLNLAINQMRLQQWEAARHTLTQAPAIPANDPTIQAHHIQLLIQLGMFQRAKDALQVPGIQLPDLIRLLASCERQLGDPQTAWQRLQAPLQAAATLPQPGLWWYEAGLAAFALHWPDDAAKAFSQAVQYCPEWPDAWHALATAHWECQQYPACHTALQRCLQQQPQHPEARCLAIRYAQQTRQYQQALERAQHLVVDLPKNTEAWRLLGNCCTDHALHQQASAAYAQAESLTSDNSLGSARLFGLNHSDHISADALAQQHQRWQRRYYPTPVTRPAAYPARQRIHIAYLSPDYNNHSVRHFLTPLLEQHDRDRFQVFCYSNTKYLDDSTLAMQAIGHPWRDCFNMTDAQICQQIKQDEIDILIDLSGHAGDARLGVLAQRPAPVQLTYLGYPNTTGLPQVDGRIVDQWSDPEDHPWHSEQLLRLTNGFLCFRPPPECALSGPAPCLQNGYITFGCFNKYCKLTDVTLDRWAQLLHAMPDAVLLIKNQLLADPQVREHLGQRFQQRDISPSRLQLKSWQDASDQHFACFADIDIALDCWPYNGTTTTCEALAAGIPVPALVGDRHAANVGVSLLWQVGYPAWIAHSVDDWIAIHRTLGEDFQALDQQRHRLRQSFPHTALGDAAAHVPHLENLYRDILQRKQT